MSIDVVWCFFLCFFPFPNQGNSARHFQTSQETQPALWSANSMTEATDWMPVATTCQKRRSTSSAFHSLRFSALFLKLWIHRSMKTKNTHSPVTSLTVTALSFWTRSLGLWPLQVGVKQPLLVRRPCAHVSKKGSRKAQVAQDKEHSISDNAQTDQQRHSLEWDFSSKDIKEPVQV